MIRPASTNPTPDLLDQARKLPNGATFHRCALQVNPHDYATNFRGDSEGTEKAQYTQDLIAEAVELGVSVLAITDHNNVDSVADFRLAAEGSGVHIFPGFELSSSEGVHVLCIYPWDTDEEKLNRYLGAFGIDNTNPSSDLSDKKLVDLLGLVAQQGGVTVAAHVTNAKGLFEVLSGQPRVQAWRSPYLQAIQIPGAVEDLSPDIRSIVENREHAYRRDDPVEERLAIAVVNARDVADPADLKGEAATCWIKMSSIGIEGLRQAFLDPGSRIRLLSEQVQAQEEEHSELLSLAWEGGFLGGSALRLNPNLNVLVGGRGTGKSSIIESLRAVLGLEPLGDDARKAHDGIVRHVLGSGTKISLLVRVCRPALREYQIERTLPNPPIVRDESGVVSKLTPLEVLPGIEVYGQHEISELTKSPEKLTNLLHRFVEPEEKADGAALDLLRRLKKNRKSLVSAMADVEAIEQRLDMLPGLEETAQRFREAGLEERLREKSLLVREQSKLDSVPERLAPYHRCAEDLRGELPIDLTFLSEKALEDLPGGPILEKLGEVLKRLEDRLEPIEASLSEALAKAESEIDAVRAEWRLREQAVQGDYNRILRELGKSRVDGEEFISLRAKIEELRPLKERLRQGQDLVAQLQSERQELLAQWEDAKASSFRSLERAAKSVSRKLRGRVEVRVKAGGNRDPLFEGLREGVGGVLRTALERLAAREELSLPHFVQTCRQGRDALVQHYKLPRPAAENVASAEPEVLMKLEELDLLPTTEIRLNTASHEEPPSWQKLDELSTGQKSTAVLLLLLLDSTAPLIVDQPEDDLDNRFITEGIVPRMREQKQKRQFLFSTHNANIPVLGDAELIVGLTATGDQDGGHARLDPSLMGSIDSQPVRELIEEILEGGKEAFERRRRKYGF